MSVIGTLDVQNLNLPAIFCLLPVTRNRIDKTKKISKKGGKIKFPPEFNIPGEILTMSYAGQTRGIIRSDHPVSFPHSIIIDVGTTHRIVSVKLSQTMEVTGPVSFQIAREAAQYIIDSVRNVQKDLNYIQEHIGDSYHVYYNFFNPNIQFENEHQLTIKKIFLRFTEDYPPEYTPTFLSFILALNKPIYSGKLKIVNLESAMINMCYDLGFCIDRSVFHDIMNEKPFTSVNNNAKTSSEVRVEYWYDKIDKTTGKVVKSRHTIGIKLSGYVNHSGPNFEAIEYVYYLFLQRVLMNIDRIQISGAPSRKINYIPSEGREISIEEYQQIVNDRNQLIKSILNGTVLSEYKDKPRLEKMTDDDEPVEPVVHHVEPERKLILNSVSTQQPVCQVINFDYQPIVS